MRAESPPARPIPAAVVRRPAAARIALLLALMLPAGRAAAQTDATLDSAIRFVRPIRVRGARSAEEILRQMTPGNVRVIRFGPEAPLTQQPWTPLGADELQRLNQARELRMGGQLEPARRLLLQMLAATPHHPQILSELAEVDLARSDWNAVEKLAKQERAPHRDSLLLAGPLATALERQGHPREAAQVAVEAWAASPESRWAPEAIDRLAPADAGVREALRSALPKRPERTDMALALAHLDWRAGDDAKALRSLGALERPERRPPLRGIFAQELLRSATPRDSSGAAEALLAIGEDARYDSLMRIPALQNAWRLLSARHGEVAAAPRITRAVQAVALDRFDPAFLVDLARALRRGGHTAEARALLGQSGPQLDAGTATLERALADLRDGPPEKALPALHDIAEASPEGGFRYAECLFFSGLGDSSLVWYKRISQDASGAWTGAALERIYMIEDVNPADALPALGRMAWQEWRGEPRAALLLADSLVRVLPQGPTWAYAAVEQSKLREAAGDARGALEPLLALADKLPGDRLAPVARQRAGDLYLDKLHDERAAVAQYEECLARYPRAWNAAEVRRRLENVRRERRF